MPKTANDLILAATSIEITAAADGKPLPKVSILAYSGGIMRVPGWGLIAIDLSKLDLGGSNVAILADHDATINGIVGQGSAEVRDGRLLVNGAVSGTTEAAQKVIDLARAGFQFQASVGIEPTASTHIAGGTLFHVNGRSITAPDGGFTLIQAGRLREVSIVSLGCDAETSVHIAAQKGHEHMTVQQLDEKTIRAQERERLVKIEDICGNLRSIPGQEDAVAKLKAQAISAEISIEQLQAGLLQILRASRPKAPAILTDNGHGDGKTMTAALFRHLGMEALGEKHLGAQQMEAARRFRGSHLLDFCKAACELDGIPVPSNRMELVRAALSTIALPTALSELANKILLDAYQESTPTWQSFCSVKSVSDFKTNTGIRPSLVGQLEQIPPGGELKHFAMNEATFSFKIDSYGKMLTLDRRDIINDDLGVFNDTARAMGQAARRKLSDLIFEILLANANGYFSAASGNLLSGVDSNLTLDGLTKAITLMASQRNAQGDDLDIKPQTLLVPPELSVAAQQILKSDQVQRQPENPTVNVLKGIVNLEVEPRLSNTQKFGNKASTKAWYLFGAPFTAPMIVAFLNGQENPQVEFFDLSTEPNRLAASWRVYFDFGAALGDPKAAVKSNGQ